MSEQQHKNTKEKTIFIFFVQWLSTYNKETYNLLFNMVDTLSSQ